MTGPDINDTGLSDNTLEKITAVIAEFSGIEKAVIFGSRAKKTYKNYSDIDIAIYASDMKEEFFKLLDKLDDLSFIYKLDIVHYDRLENKAFKQKIDHEGVVIFKRTKNG